MNTKSDNIWMAYLDNELSAGEISEFEEKASQEDIKRLEKEKKFETEIDRALPEVKCPDEVWNNVIGDIKHLERKNKSRMKFAAVAGIAALIALSALIVYYAILNQDDNLPQNQDDNFLQQIAAYPVLKQVTTLAALRSEVDIKGDEPSRAQSLLKSYGFDLVLGPIPKDGHKIRLLGAYASPCCCEGKVVALCFDCCGEPVRLVVMKEGTDFVKCCECGCREGKIQKLVKKGPYRVAAVGEHPADELINLLQPDKGILNSQIDFNNNGFLVKK